MCAQSIYPSEVVLNDAMGSVSHTLVLHVSGSAYVDFPDIPILLEITSTYYSRYEGVIDRARQFGCHAD
jgi:hypothetical protein